MKIVIEVPHFPEQFAECIELVDKQDCWDGLAVAGRTINELSEWEDILDRSETFWTFLGGLLPDAVASQLPDLESAPRDKILEHAGNLLVRTASLELGCASVDLGLDRLAWPNAAERFADLDVEMERRRDIMTALLPEAHRLGCRMSLSLRHPWPPISERVTELSLDLLERVGNHDCGLMLNTVIDELEQLTPEQALAPFLERLTVLRLHYEPVLGVRLYEDDQAAWSRFLLQNGYEGQVVFAPVFEHAAGFAAELERLAPQIWEHWR